MVEYQGSGVLTLTPTLPADSMRILLYNVGYCTALDGSWLSYLFGGYRYVYTPRKVTRRAVHSLTKMMDAHKPDVCCFVEIRKNMQRIPSFEAYAANDIQNKYGDGSLLSRMPGFRKNCNGFFSKKPMAFNRHWLKNGAKKLLYEIDLGKDTSLFFVHMSLRAKTRRKQFEDLKNWVGKRKRVILCGDFNTFRHEDDLESFARECNLRIMVPKSRGTFPAKKPRKAVDLFLCSRDINLRNIEVLNHVHASDHLPVLLEMKL